MSGDDGPSDADESGPRGDDAADGSTGEATDATPLSEIDARPPGRDERDERGGRDEPEGSFLDRLWTAEEGALLFAREMLTSVLIVAAIGLVLFAISGVWPPMVAVESGSMEPHMSRGDLVVISEPGRYVPNATHGDTGVVPMTDAKDVGYRTFGGFGSVVVYDPPGRSGAPVIHRAHFWVEEDENWYDRANPEYHPVDSCSELRNCPAPHAGFITKGDNNAGYDQVLGISEPVRPSWIVGVAHARVPLLGYIRLWLSAQIQPGIELSGGDAVVAGAAGG